MNSLHTENVQLEQMIPLIKEKLHEGNSVRLYPRGVSMLPMLRQGIDSVMLSPVPVKLKKFDLPLYQRSDGQFVLHRVVRDGDSYTCIGDNQYQYEHGVGHGQMIAVVTSFFRGEREISVNNISYRLYCRAWHFSRPLRYFLLRVRYWLRRHFG